MRPSSSFAAPTHTHHGGQLPLRSSGDLRSASPTTTANPLPPAQILAERLIAHKSTNVRQTLCLGAKVYAQSSLKIVMTYLNVATMPWA